MRQLAEKAQWKDLVVEFASKDLAGVSPEPGRSVGEPFYLRGKAYYSLKNGIKAEADLKIAIKLSPRDEMAWFTLADNYANNLKDDRQALAAYRQTLAITGRSNGWLPISVTLASARILTDQLQADEALEMLKQYGEMKDMAPVWRIKMLRAYGHVYAAQGKEQESLAKFREALALESQK